MNELSDLAQKGRSPKRLPFLVAAVCVVAFVRAFGLFLFLQTPVGREAGDWFPPLLFGHAILLAAAAYGIWNLSRWGVWLFAAALGVHQGALWAANLWTANQLAFPSAALAVVLVYHRRFQ